MNKEDYLRRIGIENSNILPTLENLKLLQRRHLLSVPFENLDIHLKHSIVLKTENFAEKILKEKRGGFCYELNGLFYELLNKIGYNSRIISARVSNGKADFGAEYDHLAILTEIENEEFFVDVGFGDFAAEPLNLVLNIEQEDANGIFLIRKFDDDYFEIAKKHGGEWKSEYIFKNLKRDLSEFSEMCKFHQTSPESHFTRGKVCSIMTNDGRKTLTNKKFIETKKGQKITTDINSEGHFHQLLAREFDIKLPTN